jgi:DNA-binding response OmpR family regulator
MLWSIIMLLQRESHIVVVDPRPRDYRGLVTLAGEREWHLHFLTSARAALRFNAGGSVDLWLVNFTLPDLAGIELMRLLRDRANSARVFIVADEYKTSHEKAACQKGADLFVCKDAKGSLDCFAMLDAFCRDPCTSVEPIGES